MVRRKWLFVSVGLVVWVGFLVWMLVLDLNKEAQVKEERRQIPLVEISLSGATLDEINEGGKEVKYEGNSLRLTEGAEVRDFENIEIKGRGNSTWGMPKKPYQIKFEQGVDLLGLGKAKKWVLLANYLDVSQIRNDVAMKVAQMLGWDDARGRFVELEVDGEYMGLYYLMHKVEIGKNAVNLRNPLGILVEVDNLHSGPEKCYASGNGVCVTVADVVDKDLTEVAMGEFMDSFNALEEAAKNRDYVTIENLIDVESFAKYYLVSEFTVNPDAYSTSWFMYKDGADDKIHAGPVWDFDYALGNKEWVWNTTEDFYSPDKNMIRELDVMGGEYILDGEVIEKEPDTGTARLMYDLMKIPEFRAEVEELFDEYMSGRSEELIEYVAWRASEIYGAYLRDYAKWERGDFVEEVGYLLDWIEKRFAHFEREYGGYKADKIEEVQDAEWVNVSEENVYVFDLYDIMEEEV